MCSWSAVFGQSEVITFQKWNVEDGLSNSIIRNIAQDSAAAICGSPLSMALIGLMGYSLSTISVCLVILQACPIIHFSGLESMPPVWCGWVVIMA